MKNVFIDFDDTMTNSLDTITRILNRRFYGDFCFSNATKWKTSEDILRWDMTDAYPELKEMPSDYITKVFESEEFWLNVDCKRHVLLGLLYLINRYGDDITFTVLTKGTHKNLIKKQEFVRARTKCLEIKSGKEVQFIGLSPTQSKGEILMPKGSIMVDDNLNYLKETNADYKILFTGNTYHLKGEREWQKGDREGIFEARDWDDVIEIITRIYG